MKRTLLLDIVIRKGPTVLQLFPSEDQSLLVGWDPFFVLDLGFHIVDRVGGFDFESDGLARQAGISQRRYRNRDQDRDRDWDRDRDRDRVQWDWRREEPDLRLDEDLHLELCLSNDGILGKAEEREILGLRFRLMLIGDCAGA